MRVLLVEDEPTLAQSIELMLRSETFEVVTAVLGQEGLSRARTGTHDIILLDLNLPDMSGYDVLRSLRATRVKTPVLILSGLAGIDNKVKGLGFGADDYLTKPFGMDEPELKIIDVFICKLRKKLADASGGKNYIETVWGRGYALRPPEEIQLS